MKFPTKEKFELKGNKRLLQSVQVVLKKNYFEIILFSIFLIYLLVVRYYLLFFKGFFIWPVGEGVIDWDMYMIMSRDITSIFKGEVVVPFCYRPLIPFFAGILPFDLQTNYAIINFISVYLMGILLYYTLRIKFDRKFSLIGLLLFVYLNYVPSCTGFIMLYPFLHGNFYLVYNVDASAMLIVMGCFYCIFSSKKRGYYILLFIGVLIKESVMFTIPVFFIYEIFTNKTFANRKLLLNELLKNSKYILPALLVFLAIKMIVVPLPLSETIWEISYQGNEYGSWEMILMFVDLRIQEILYENALIRWTIGAWSPLIIGFCCLNTFKKVGNWLVVFGIYLVFTYGQLIIGFSDIRYIQYCFYPIIYLAVSGIRNIHCGFSIGPFYQQDLEISHLRHVYFIKYENWEKTLNKRIK